MSDTPSTPDPFDVAYAEGSRLFEQQRYDEAIEAFARAASHRPDDFRPWEMTACCHDSNGTRSGTAGERRALSGLVASPRE
jgi:Flp pilus assembly protein TadD